MNWLKKLFGYRTDRAPSGSLALATLQAEAVTFAFNLGLRHGRNVTTAQVANTNSMLPVFDANAILLLEHVPFDALREGDIVTYRSRGKLIVHRLNERRPGGWWPLGDGNGTMDPELVTPANLDRRLCGILYAAKDATTDN